MVEICHLAYRLQQWPLRTRSHSIALQVGSMVAQTLVGAKGKADACGRLLSVDWLEEQVVRVGLQNTHIRAERMKGLGKARCRMALSRKAALFDLLSK